MRLTIFSLILMLCAYSFNVNAGSKGIWFTQAIQTTAGKVKSAAGTALVIAAACFNFSACDVNTPIEQLNQILEDGKLVSSDYVDLDTHNGIILVERGSLLTMQATPNSIAVKIDVGMMELGEDGEWVFVDPEIEETYVSNVQLAILDGNGEVMEGALMMWQQPKLQAEHVGDVAVFEQLFVPVYLPAGAQLYMTGAVRGDGDGYYFDIATIEPSGIDLAFEDYSLVLERFPPIYVSFLNYGEAEKFINPLDWYVHVWGDNNTAPAVSDVMPIINFGRGFEVRFDQGDEFFKNLPDRHRVVTRVTTKNGGGEDKVVIAIVD